MGKAPISGRCVGDAYMRPVGFAGYIALPGWLPAANAFPLGGRWRARAPDEGEMSGSYPLISHLR